MSYGLKQSQIIIKPLADATKGAIEFNRDVTGNPEDNVILQDIYLGDNETMVYNPNTGLVTGVISHFKTAFINGELTSNSEYAVVASTLDGTSTPSTFTPSYLQVGHFAVTSGTLTDYGVGGTVDVGISAGDSLGHVDLLDNFVVMHPQHASIPGATKKDMGLLFSKNADSSAAFYLDHTNGEFYLHNIAHTDQKIDIHDLSGTTGTLTLATLNVGALNISGSAISLDSLSDVDVSSTPPSTGQVLKYNGSTWVNDTDNSGGGALADLTDVAVGNVKNGEFLVYSGSPDNEWQHVGVISTTRLTFSSGLFSGIDTVGVAFNGTLGGAGDTYTLSAFNDLEATFLITSTSSSYNVVLPSLASMDAYRSQKIVFTNTGSTSFNITTDGSGDTYEDGTTTFTLKRGETVTFLVDGVNDTPYLAFYRIYSAMRVMSPVYEKWTYTGGTFTSSLTGATVAGHTITLSATDLSTFDLLYLAKTLEKVIVVQDNTASSTFNLFPADSIPTGFKVVVKNVGSQIVNLNRNSGTSDLIDGETSIELPLQYSSITLVSNGVDAWYIL